jgi:hypothetical protein
MRLPWCDGFERLSKSCNVILRPLQSNDKAGKHLARLALRSSMSLKLDADLGCWMYVKGMDRLYVVASHRNYA